MESSSPQHRLLCSPELYLSDLSIGYIITIASVYRHKCMQACDQSTSGFRLGGTWAGWGLFVLAFSAAASQKLQLKSLMPLRLIEVHSTSKISDKQRLVAAQLLIGGVHGKLSHTEEYLSMASLAMPEKIAEANEYALQRLLGVPGDTDNTRRQESDALSEAWQRLFAAAINRIPAGRQAAHSEAQQG